MKHRLKHPRCLAKFLLHSFHTTSRWSQTIGEIANHRPIHILPSQQTRFISETILRSLMPTAYPLERIRSTTKVRKEMVARFPPCFSTKGSPKVSLKALRFRKGENEYAPDL